MTRLKGIGFGKIEKKNDEKFDKNIFTLSERTGLGIGDEVETS